MNLKEITEFLSITNSRFFFIFKLWFCVECLMILMKHKWIEVVPNFDFYNLLVQLFMLWNNAQSY